MGSSSSKRRRRKLRESKDRPTVASSITFLEKTGSSKKSTSSSRKAPSKTFSIAQHYGVCDDLTSVDKSGLLHDISFVCGKYGKEIKANRFMMSLQLPGLTVLADKTKDRFEFPEYDPEFVQAIVTLALTGTLVMDLDSDIASVIAVLDDLEADCLINTVQAMLIQTLDCDNVFRYAAIADKCELEELCVACAVLLSSEVHNLYTDTRFFEAVPRSIFRALFQLEGVPPSLTESLFVQIAVKYGNALRLKAGLTSDTSEVKAISAVPDLAKHIRWGLVNPELLTAACEARILPKSVIIASLAASLDPTLRKSKIEGLNAEPRVMEYECKRYGSIGSSWGYGGSRDAVAFTVSQPVSFAGLGIIPCNSGTTSITLTFRDKNSVLATQVGSFTKGTDQYELMRIKEPVPLTPKQTYHVIIVQRGTNSPYAQSCKTTIEDPLTGLKVKFVSSSHSNNGTGTSSGQIPTILFNYPKTEKTKVTGLFEDIPAVTPTAAAT